MKSIFGIAVLLSLAACSTTPNHSPEPQTVAAAKDSKETCRMVKVTGTTLPVRRCESTE